MSPPKSIKLRAFLDVRIESPGSMKATRWFPWEAGRPVSMGSRAPSKVQKIKKTTMKHNSWHEQRHVALPAFHGG